jgi:hypothetical protein
MRQHGSLSPPGWHTPLLHLALAPQLVLSGLFVYLHCPVVREQEAQAWQGPKGQEQGLQGPLPPRDQVLGRQALQRLGFRSSKPAGHTAGSSKEWRGWSAAFRRQPEEHS